MLGRPPGDAEETRGANDARVVYVTDLRELSVPSTPSRIEATKRVRVPK